MSASASCWPYQVTGGLDTMFCFSWEMKMPPVPDRASILSNTGGSRLLTNILRFFAIHCCHYCSRHCQIALARQEKRLAIFDNFVLHPCPQPSPPGWWIDPMSGHLQVPESLRSYWPNRRLPLLHLAFVHSPVKLSWSSVIFCSSGFSPLFAGHRKNRRTEERGSSSSLKERENGRTRFFQFSRSEERGNRRPEELGERKNAF